MWLDRLPAKYRDRAPRMVRDGDNQYGCYEDKVCPPRALSAVVGKDKEEFSPESAAVRRHAARVLRPGRPRSTTWTAPASSRRSASRRSRASAARSSGRRRTRSSRFSVVQAYNDWMIDEWCGAAPGRFIPLVHHPAVGPAARGRRDRAHARRRARRTFAFSENPEPLGLPTIHDPDRYWDPVMAAAQDTRDGRVACTSARRRRCR